MPVDNISKVILPVLAKYTYDNKVRLWRFLIGVALMDE